MKILVTGVIPKEGVELLKSKFEVTYQEEPFSREYILENLHKYDGVLLMAIKADKEFIDAGKNLKIISINGVGYDHVDINYAREKGIAVANVPIAVCEPTAELAFALTLSAARRLKYYDDNVRAKNWFNVSYREHMGLQLYGEVAGIYGMGKIGQAYARRAKAFGMKVIYNDIRKLPNELEKELGAEYVEFDELLEKSAVISLHAPLLESTRGRFGIEEFKKMRKDAFIVNTARGQLVKEKDLIQALKEKEIAGAGLDVFENEPEIDDELLKMDNVVMSPHAGTGCLASRIAIAEEATMNLISFLLKNETLNVIN